MWIDLLSMFVVVFFASAGYFRGFISLLFTFFAVLASYILTQHLAHLLEGFGDWSGLDPEMRYWMLTSIAALIIYLGVNFIGLIAAHFIVGKEENRRRTDRILGTILGVIQGGMIALFVACLMGAVPEPLRESWGWLDEEVDQSQLVKLVDPYNPVLGRQEEIGWIRKIGDTIEILGDPATLENLDLPENVRNLLKNEEISKLLTDSDFVKALRETDYSEIFSTKKWHDTVNDEDLKKALKDVDLEEVRSEIERAREVQERAAQKAGDAAGKVSP